MPCQDAHRYELVSLPDGQSTLIAVVSDGAGSASRSEVGSALTCEGFINLAKAHLLAGLSVEQITKATSEAWLISIQEMLGAEAGRMNATLQDYACTVLGVLVADDQAVFVQLGDGAIVVADRSQNDAFSWIFWPQQGEYINTTVFITSERAMVSSQ